nr:MAG TPA: hypothetical protein [Caudoviricetes sp.]
MCGKIFLIFLKFILDIFCALVIVYSYPVRGRENRPGWRWQAQYKKCGRFGIPQKQCPVRKTVIP